MHMLIVDDHELVRVGLKSAIHAIHGDDVIALEASRLADAADLYERHAEKIALVILDLNLPDCKGLSAVSTFKARFPLSRIVVLSATADESIGNEALVLGATHFFRKSDDLTALNALVLDARSAWERGDPRRVSSLRTTQSRNHLGTHMTSREVEILELVLQGKSNNEIVETTQLKLGTIKNYISGILLVFGVDSRSKLITLFK
jgi:DNA-binding NarL/FixJ family response regulator